MPALKAQNSCPQSTAKLGGIFGQYGVIVDGSDGAGCEYFADAEAGARALHHRVVKLLLNARTDLLWVHAGAVASAGQAAVLAAPSGHGKSTMVAEFLARGWTYLSDEIAQSILVARASFRSPCHHTNGSVQEGVWQKARWTS